MALLGVDEVLKYALRIEENGEAFYRQWARRTDDENLKVLFNFLADEEIDHKKIFEALVTELGAVNFRPEGIDNQEYQDHLEKVSREVLYNVENYQKEMQRVTNLSSAVELALKQELDSVFFYSDLKKFMPKEQIGMMDKIIDEEQKHCTNLEELKEKLSRQGSA